MDIIDSGSCPMQSFAVNGFELLDSAATDLPSYISSELPVAFLTI